MEIEQLKLMSRLDQMEAEKEDVIRDIRRLESAVAQRKAMLEYLQRDKPVEDKK